jgi:hypothetical protein
MPGQRVSMQLEQAFALMLAGNLSDAYDTLAVVLTGAADDGNRFTAQAFCGLIRHAQWASAMQAAAAQMQPKPSPGAVSVLPVLQSTSPPLHSGLWHQLEGVVHGGASCLQDAQKWTQLQA